MPWFTKADILMFIVSGVGLIVYAIISLIKKKRKK